MATNMSIESIGNDSHHLSSLSHRKSDAIDKLRLADWKPLSESIHDMLTKAYHSIDEFAVHESRQLTAKLLDLTNRSDELQKEFVDYARETIASFRLKNNERSAFAKEMLALTEYYKQLKNYITSHSAKTEIVDKDLKDCEEEHEKLEERHNLFEETNTDVVGFKANRGQHCSDPNQTYFEDRFEKLGESYKLVAIEWKVLDTLLTDCVTKIKNCNQMMDKWEVDSESMTGVIESNVDQFFIRINEIQCELETLQLTIDMLANY